MRRNNARFSGRPVGDMKATEGQWAVRCYMTKENSTWAYTRIRGALFNLGHEIDRNTPQSKSRGTIKRMPPEAGMEPAPERGKRTSENAQVGVSSAS